MMKKHIPIKSFSFLLAVCLLVSAAFPCFSAAEAVKDAVVRSDADGNAATPTDATPTDAPACAVTGEHQWAAYTCAGDGTHTAVCALCGAEASSACDYGEEPLWTAAGDGNHTVACLLCGGIRTEPCVLTDTVVPPTQAEGGYTRHECAVCGYSYQDAETPPEQDRLESRQTGDADGDGTVRSADARAIMRAVVTLEPLPAESLPYADLDANGELTPADARTALRISVGLEPAAERHAYTVAVTQAPTCTAGGKLSYTCDYCGREGALASPADGHRYGEPLIKEATCTQPGVRTAVCGVCGYRNVTAIPAAGHRFGEPVVVEATCTQDGSSTIVCAVCGEREVAPLPAEGHRFGEPVVIDPTCTQDGSSTITCAACGEREVTPLPAAGHQWQEDAGKKRIACAVCGEGASGWVTLNKKVYHCVKGAKDLSWCVIDGARYFFDRNTGVMAKGVKVDGIKLAADGKAPTDSYSAEKIRTLINAKKILAGITDPSDPVNVKKKKAFDWVMGYNYVQYRLVGASMQKPGFEMLFANDIFEKNRTGCCGSTSYAFAFLAVEAGCKQVYVCDDGVSTSGHAWVTMEGNNRVYDVVFAKAKGYSINYDAAVSDYRNWPPRKTYVGG